MLISIAACVDHLYKAESLREVGALKYFRERVNRKNVTPDKVTKSFEGTEDFFVEQCWNSIHPGGSYGIFWFE